VKIAFVHGHLLLGGIETLILKLAREFVATGHSVTVVAGPRGNPQLETNLRRYAKLVRLPSSFMRGYLSGSRADLADVDIIFACGAPQLLLAQALKLRHAPRAVTVVGVYSPWEFTPGIGARRFDWQLTDRLFAAVPDENVIFVNEPCRSEHRLTLRRSFEASPVIVVPTDRPALPANRIVDREKIVSIGRIVHFKPTPFHMLEVIAEMKKLGRRFVFHVYGVGVAFDALKEAVVEKGLEEVVTLHGAIDYDDIPRALEDCFLFVGMATAALEAAALGVPSLMGYEAPDERVTLGFVHETVENAMGELSSKGKRYPLLDKVKELDAMSSAAYAETARKGQDHARQFSSEAIAAQYISAFENARRFDFPVGFWEFVRSIVSAVNWKIRGLLGEHHPDTDRYTGRIGAQSAVAANG